MPSSSTIRKTPGSKAPKTTDKTTGKTTAKTTAKTATKASALAAEKASGRADVKVAGKATEKASGKTSGKATGKATGRSTGKTTASLADVAPTAVHAAVSAVSPPSAAADSPAAPTTGSAVKLRDLVDRVASTTGQPRPQVKSAVEAALAIISEALDQGQPLNLPHLGKIRVSKAGNPAEAQPMVLKLRRDLSGPKHG